MSMYEYECIECGWIFDVEHSIKDNPIIECQQCKGKTKKNILGDFSMKLKGAGFHKNDYPKWNDK